VDHLVEQGTGTDDVLRLLLEVVEEPDFLGIRLNINPGQV